ncbi:MAG: nucleotidyltransferase family protein [Acidimicrobiaceae bacterium]|nr:nucleotidyltransferase family protein [Acidimicrobiaceae bacterium]MYE98469.1 nucleotidyltransferase family protein [Acidimicrobiaceae bacterium]MYH43736.1 nucleotidyltransferase family protein [Acidimicrobiaceae bacterium]MYI52834.1 nucleotidyltransferase family protein [Acidimicrobiaceae bacterium]MYK72980.1 nucleotidyltransferase family protein [Acidimicrobiaceae bacterium]
MNERSRPVDQLGRDQVLEALRAHKATLAERFGVISISLFGSVARDQASAGSDLDLLVRFDGPTTSRAYFGVQFYLEDLLGRRVDLVTDKALRAELRPYVEREAIDV